MMKSLLLVAIFGMFILSGCNDEPKERTSILGTWNCEEIPETTTPTNYQVNIKRNLLLPGANNEYIINNFYKLGHSEASEVYFYQDSITLELIIRQQNVGGTSIYGTGVVAPDYSNIKWTYQINATSVTEIVVATYY